MNTTALTTGPDQILTTAGPSPFDEAMSRYLETRKSRPGVGLPVPRSRGKSKTALWSGRLPQVAIDHSNQLVHSHRLGEMGVGTGLQGLHFVFGTAPG